MALRTIPKCFHDTKVCIRILSKNNLSSSFLLGTCSVQHLQRALCSLVIKKVIQDIARNIIHYKKLKKEVG